MGQWCWLRRCPARNAGADGSLLCAGDDVDGLCGARLVRLGEGGGWRKGAAGISSKSRLKEDTNFIHSIWHHPATAALREMEAAAARRNKATNNMAAASPSEGESLCGLLGSGAASDSVGGAVASAYGRVLHFGHAPALPTSDGLFGSWEPPASAAEGLLLPPPAGAPPGGAAAAAAMLDRRLRNQRPMAVATENSLPHVVQGAGGEEGLVVVDNVFSAAVVAQLKAVCDESTVFFDMKSGYLGAYLGDGLATGLLLQAAAMLRTRLPWSIGREVLSQAWAYKYDSEVEQGIRMHVDQGEYSVNCWLTPDDALDSDSAAASTGTEGGLGLGHGGLRHFRGAAVEDDDSVVATRLRNDTFGRSNQDFRFLQQAVDDAERRSRQGAQLDDGDHDDLPVSKRPGVTVIEVPYKENRCVIFRSGLLHETATVRFKSGYKNRRIPDVHVGVAPLTTKKSAVQKRAESENLLIV